MIDFPLPRHVGRQTIGQTELWYASDRQRACGSIATASRGRSRLQRSNAEWPCSVSLRPTVCVNTRSSSRATRKKEAQGTDRQPRIPFLSILSPKRKWDRTRLDVDRVVVASSIHWDSTLARRDRCQPLSAACGDGDRKSGRHPKRRGAHEGLEAW